PNPAGFALALALNNGTTQQGVILSAASRSLTATGAVEGPAFRPQLPPSPPQPGTLHLQDRRRRQIHPT
ncbi:MAG: hypothetical protein M3Y72_04415, partial [Acidobacteriota bacterium]|nr:hypothetical protein [Acidobacteriota bacterium]